MTPRKKEGDDSNSISPERRSLRPRKIENYQQMLEDEVTLKTIKDEELEKKRMSNIKAGTPSKAGHFREDDDLTLD